ncbi:DUF4270 domain-containing protein [Sphingobacterium olei]|uniref:DUF4270 domain-containing protein n=2 Tax=Sphingobacterium olei TaxID=2571155 RepID=A0A4V6WHX0_9SPHI|nr:DUF4270 domain-containing protein [Sphingobacterium olei]
MRQLLLFKYIFLTFSSLIIITLGSCDKDMSVSLGNTNENFGITVVDSITVNASTFQMSNLPSAGTGTILVGKASQEEIGSAKSTSYFKLAFTNFTNDIPTDAVFDSINLVIKPKTNRYFYGDTTVAQKITVHRLTEALETKNISSTVNGNITPIFVTGATIFSDQKFDYDASPLGSLTFNPFVRSIDTLDIKLNSALGSEIFDMIVSNDLDVASNEAFQQYLKGLVIVPNDQNTVILGFSDTVTVNINYSYIGNDGFNKRGVKSITTGDRTFQFNNIEYDRTNTPFAALNTTNKEIKSSQTNGQVFLQAGTGAVAKLDIPALKEFMNEPNISINKAQLIVETTGEFFFNPFPNPSSVMLLIANDNGIPFSYVRTPFSTSIQQVPYINGNSMGRNARYVFDLIEYINTVNNVESYNTSLFLTSSTPNLFSTVNMALIATENNLPKIKLNIVYTKFK